MRSMRLADVALDAQDSATAAAQMIRRANRSEDPATKAVLYKTAIEALVDDVIVPLSKVLGDRSVHGVDLPTRRGFQVVHGDERAGKEAA